MKTIINDELLFAEFALMKKAREHIQELSIIEIMALKSLGVTVLQDVQTGENTIVG